MTPLFSPCSGCSHPAIKAAKQCKTAMALANDGRAGEAEALLNTAMGGLRRAGMPLMKAKILNSLAWSTPSRTGTSRPDAACPRPCASSPGTWVRTTGSTPASQPTGTAWPRNNVSPSSLRTGRQAHSPAPLPHCHPYAKTPSLVGPGSSSRVLTARNISSGGML